MATLGNVPAEAYTNTVKDSFSGNGSATAFTMSLPTVTNDVRVVVENVIQDPTVAYSVSGTTLTFTSAPPSGTNNIYVVHLGPAVMTTVPPAEIADATTFASSLTVQGAFTSVGIDDNADAVALTIDSSENVLIGQTTASSGTVGTSLRPDGRNFYCADGNYSAHFNRNSSDGAIAHFAKDDTIVGSIGSKSGSLLIGSTDTYLRVNDPSDTIFPSNSSGAERDNTINLGKGSSRFKDLYLSGGVYLGGTGSANKLDDYEEGTFTPQLNFGGSNNGITYSSRLGLYTKIGDTVTLWGNCILTSKGSASGNVSISGLPFTPISGYGNHKFGTFAIASNMASMPQTNTWVMPHTNSQMYLRYQGSTTEGDLNNSNFTNSSNFGWTVTYKTS